ncbi:hypothetical protein [Phytopseudomonas daroniae]|uniref:hypothetical protein n=1 Tax=Phytopseudomonas daroniae TaxID=2487519 RepID=UPI00103830DF|nr:hypothetical protein [Pseudomonas daroniae]TBU73323.1 hypothetical protein DNK10_18850 [Pseudomonas daroniae]
MTESSTEAFVRLIKSKHDSLIKSLIRLQKALVGEDIQKKVDYAKKALEEAAALSSLLTAPDKPNWLQPLCQRLQIYNNNPSVEAYNFLQAIIPLIEPIHNHDWFGSTHKNALDFDAIFEKYKKESRLNELFQEIIRILESILESGEIDSNSMQRALERMISTLRSCKKGSYFHINSSWEFLINFIQNYLWEELGKIPALGSAVTALRKTLEETNEEMFKVHNSVKKELENSVEDEVKSLKGKATFNFPTYNKLGFIPPEGNDNKFIGEA